MQRMQQLAMAGVMLVAVSASASAGGVTVSFVDPEHYTDANLRGGSGERARLPALREIEDQLRRLGERYLRPDETLAVEILDIDLAGRFEPWRPFAHDVRFMRDITWPRVKLRYRLAGAGQAPRGGEETVADQTYLWHAGMRSSGEVMPYEKAMLEAWFRTRFAAPPRRADAG